MSDIVKAILGLVLALLLFGGGYSFGSRQVAALKAEIGKLEDTGKLLKAERDKIQADVDRTMQERQKAFEAEKLGLIAQAERNAQARKKALDDATARNKTLQTQLDSAAAEKQQLEAKAGGKDQAKIEDLNQRIGALRAQLCLALPVPQANIDPLLK
jgi:chromosome segregation ATPase